MSASSRRLVQHLVNFLLAALLALLLWVLVQMQIDPNVTRTLPFTVPIQIRGKDPALILVEGPKTGVTVTLRAPQSVWERIVATRAVDAEVDLTGLGPGVHEVPVRLIIRATPVEVVDFDPPTVQIHLEPLAEKRLPVSVQLLGEPAVGFRADPPQVRPAYVTVRGPKNRVDQVDRVVVRATITNRRETLDMRLDPIPYTKEGRVASGVEVIPDTVRVVVPITQLGGYRDVSVRVDLKGRPAPGYHITNIAVYPSIVTLFSNDPQQVLKIPGFVETETVDVEGATQDIEVRVGLKLPKGVQVVGEKTVLVQISIEPIQGSATVQVPVEVVGLPAGMDAQVSPEEVDVVVLGPLPIIRDLKVESLRVYVDVSGLEPGVYTLEVKTEVLLPEVSVTSVVPNQVEVTLTSTATTTPTATAGP